MARLGHRQLQGTLIFFGASGGYPGHYEKGKAVIGLDGHALEGTLVFQSGTIAEDDAIVTNGGRVLAVTAYGENINEAVEQSVYMLEQLHFDDMYYVSDIEYEVMESDPHAYTVETRGD